MAVQTYFASGAQNPAVQGQAPIPDEQVGGHLHLTLSRQLVANGDSATSTITFCKVPSSARIERGSRIDADAIAGNTSFSLGDANYPTGLMNAVDIHVGGQFNPAGITNANMDQALWQLLGYAADPLSEIVLIGTLGAALTAGGSIALTLKYSLAI